MTEIHHEKFLRNLSRSRAAVIQAAEWLSRRGNQVVINPTTFAETHAQWGAHADQGDLFVMSRIEVKRLSARFTSREDWPFKDFIVCAKHSWDGAVRKPLSFIYFNRDMTHCAVLQGLSCGEWWTSDRPDRRYPGYRQDFYVCSPALPTFVSVVE